MKKTEIIDYNPKALWSFHIYSYEWIDNLNFTLKPEDCLAEPTKYTDVVREILLQDGWDGDGEIELMWVPPFTFADEQDSGHANGIVIWHVKQLENGISWILSPLELPFRSFGFK